jgi:hypothetical protein
MTDDRRQRSDDREHRTVDSSPRTEDRRQGAGGRKKVRRSEVEKVRQKRALVIAIGY